MKKPLIEPACKDKGFQKENELVYLRNRVASSE